MQDVLFIRSPFEENNFVGVFIAVCLFPFGIVVDIRTVLGVSVALRFRISLFPELHGMLKTGIQRQQENEGCVH